MKLKLNAEDRLKLANALNAMKPDYGIDDASKRTFNLFRDAIAIGVAVEIPSRERAPDPQPEVQPAQVKNEGDK